MNNHNPTHLIKQTLVAFLLVFALQPLKAEDTIRPSIVGGSDADSGQYPWMAALLRIDSEETATNRQFCGGALIAPNWILTAAHCVDDSDREFEIMVGNTNLEDSYVPVFPRSIHIHRSFQTRRISRGSDIALIEIDPPIEDYPSIEINRALNRIVPGRQVTAIGWGRTDYETNSKPSKLQQVDLTLRKVDGYEDNHPAYDYFISTERNLIEKGIYSGDSGGPLLLRDEDNESWKIVGLTSNSVRNIEANINATLFTNVAAVKDWIDRVLSSTNTVPDAPPAHKRVKVFADESGNAYAGYQLWPFAGKRTETLSFPGRDPTLPTFLYSPFLDPGNYYDEESGAVFMIDTKYSLSNRAQSARASLATLTEEDKPNYQRPLFKLEPFETITFKKDSYTNAIRLQALQPNQGYSIGSNRGSQPVLLQNRSTGKLSERKIDAFVSSPDFNYWMAENIGHKGQTISIIPKTDTILSIGETMPSELTANSHPFKRPQTYIKLFQPQLPAFAGEVKITLLPEFDGEIILLNRFDGSPIAYADQGSENETDTLIVDYTDIRNGVIGVTNFDKGITGRFDITTERHSSGSLSFDSNEQRGITSNDSKFTTSSGRLIRYERLSIYNNRNYRYLTFKVHGFYFRPGVAILDGQGNQLEFETNQQNYTLTVPVSSRETITIDVLNYEGTLVENYEIEVTGSLSEP